MVTQKLLLSRLQDPVIRGETRPETWRRKQLGRFRDLIDQHEEKVLKALQQDLGKPSTEAFFELLALRIELNLTEKHLRSWMRPQPVKVPLSQRPGQAKVKHEPLGCVLIIGPWNYPFSLTLQPLISALAAGNTAVLKPSEHAQATSELISQLISQHFPEDVVQVIQGDGDIAAELVQLPFDHIFFTGGIATGKKVMAAAAQNLTPVTLELGGKSPAIVIEGADLAVTAKRLIWGKTLNAGQTCIAPDHLIVQESIKQPLLEAMTQVIDEFHGPDPLQSPHLGNIINDQQFQRLHGLLQGAKQRGGVLVGGDVDAEKRRIAPALISVDNLDDPLMQEELFGPLLPILTTNNLESALLGIQHKPHPLAIYLFGGTNEQQQQLLNSSSSGGVCFNDVIMQAAIPDLPFGGIGASGMGSYHGHTGFKTFSHSKAVLKRPFWLDLKFRYPPYTIDLALLKKLLR